MRLLSVASRPPFFASAPAGSHGTGILHGGAATDQVQKLIDGILKEWAEAEERLLMPDINDIEYRAMRPTNIVRFKARIKLRGRGRPLPYEGSDDGE